MASEENEDYTVEVGYVLGPRGDEGAVVVEPLTDVPDRFYNLQQVWLRPRVGPGHLCRVLEVIDQTSRGHLVIRIAGVDSREAAGKLRGAVLCVRPQDSPPLPEGLFYVHQILGLDVVTKDGRCLGRVEEILRTGANDVYVVGKYLVPAVRQVVVEIDLKASRIVIDPLPGLLSQE
jgi:16S rRNA processing protein RimM